MENGVRFDEGSNLSRQLSNLSIGSSVNGYSNNTSVANGVNKGDGLFQVMKAVEAAEATIKQLVEENNRLKSELQIKINNMENVKIEELENYESSDRKAESTHPIGHWNDHENKDFMETQRINEVINMVPSGHTTTDNGGMISSAFTSSFSPLRYRPEGEYDPEFNVPAHGQRLVRISEVQKVGIPLNQVVIDTRDQEQEILLLRKHLADYSIKEAQMHNEKLSLEKRIAYMRLAFDQQQKDLVDAAYKALSYRQEIIEENIRLTYALQDAQEERSTFISSLMPLLTEYSLQPQVVDAQSIVSNVKVFTNKPAAFFPSNCVPF